MTYFDEQAKGWDANPMRVERAKTVAQSIRETLPLRPGMSALELGCGTGLLSFALLQDFASITLADTSPGMLDVLSDKIKAASADNMHPLRLDLASDPLPASRFDVIYSLMTLHHIPNTDQTLRQCHALTAPGGWLCIADLDKDDGSFHLDTPDFDGHHGFEREALQRQVEAAGFGQVTFRTAYVIQKGERHYPVFLLTAQKIDITIEQASLEDFLTMHNYNYSAEALQFDSPNRPMPSLEAEKVWWKTDVETGKHIVYAIKDQGSTLVGFVHGFSFTEQECETGINVFPKSNWNKGIGLAASQLFIEVLREKFGMTKIRAEVNQENGAALALYKKLGFQETGSYQEDRIIWKVLRL